MWRDARMVAFATLVVAACGDAESASPTSRPPATTLASQAAPVATPAAATTTERVARPPSVLVLTRTAGFRHTSIEPAAEALRSGLTALGIGVVVDPDASHVNPEELATFDAIVMLSTTGDWLDDAQQAAIEQWAAGGGAIAGIHAATDAEPSWTFVEQVLGARFAGHPAVQPATVSIEDATHPATSSLPEHWTVTDEWYDLAPNPRDVVHVLATVDEATYAGGHMGPDHPIEWTREPSAIAGRVWYTAMGHPDELWADPVFTAHVVAGIAWTAGVDVRQPHGFASGATVNEAADRLTAFDVG